MGPVTTQEKGPQYSENRTRESRCGCFGVQKSLISSGNPRLSGQQLSHYIDYALLLHHGYFGIAKQHAFYKKKGIN
jgi:hypothetical protein